MADYRRNPYGRQSCCQQPDGSRPAVPPAPSPKPGFSEKFPLAMAYVPWQEFQGMYDDLEKAYCAGTIFPELDKPFTGRRCVS